jgi:hypothetical protein
LPTAPRCLEELLDEAQRQRALAELASGPGRSGFRLRHDTGEALAQGRASGCCDAAILRGLEA